jgi:hypothetical protein
MSGGARHRCAAIGTAVRDEQHDGRGDQDKGGDKAPRGGGPIDRVRRAAHDRLRGVNSALRF